MSILGLHSNSPMPTQSGVSHRNRTANPQRFCLQLFLTYIMRFAILTFVPALLVTALTSQENVLLPGSLSFPIGVLTDSQGLVYTTSKGDGASVGGELAVYDPATNTQSAIASNLATVNIPAGHPVGAHHMSWNPTQAGVVTLVNGASGLLEDIDVATGQVVGGSVDMRSFVVSSGYPDSNSYSVAYDGAGNRYVADSGANAVFKVDPSGSIAIFAQFPNLANNGPPQVGQQFVPTKILADGSGGFWVSGFSGGPFFAGTARVAHVSASGSITYPFTSLTTIIDIAINPVDGSLYALSFGGFDPAAGQFIPGTGEILKLGGGVSDVVLSGLNMPTGMSFTPAGDLYYVEWFGPLGPGDGSMSRLVAGRVEVVGAGCGGLQLSSSGQAAIGNSMWLDITGGAAGSSLMAISASMGGCAGPGVQLPTPLFALGCEAYILSSAVSIGSFINTPAGSVIIVVPSNPLFIGLQICAQAGAADSLGFRSSNGLDITIGAL